MIDIHTHIMYHWGKQNLTEGKLLRRMDALGVDKFVVLPIIGPEVPYRYFGTEDVLKACRRHPDRMIPFCSIDPRAGKNAPETDFSPMLNEYREAGCRGLGELTANMYFDDPRCLNLYRQCGDAGLPVLFHMHSGFLGSYGLVDDVGLPRLERALKLCPGTNFIGHSPVFWSEISAVVDEEKRCGYPKEPVEKPGRVQELLEEYTNLYGDISAGSGYNALTRDAVYGREFMEKYSARLLFGTDICGPGQKIRITGFLESVLAAGGLSKTAYGRITRKNAEKLLELK